MNDFRFAGQGAPPQIYVLDTKYGDVTGDGVIDTVFLVGEKPYGTESPFVDHITVFIQDGQTHLYYRVIPKEASGYNPTIFLGDFTGNHVDDILISTSSGGSGGYAFYDMYAFINHRPVLIFNHETFNEHYTYTVTYKDHFQVKVVGSDSKTYTIDITYKGEEYLAEIYEPDGRLKESIEGWVNPLGDLYPVDFQRDGVYGLYAARRIAGRYNADGLGYVQMSLEWDGRQFMPFFQTVGIFGGDSSATP
ncbi:spore coat protein [Salipaludibacillus keqinensis]|uniref:Spore coat protein n=1 Tax=Salipaludibacillus keqinensis TaxID=2045207 RepID=A0A323TI19_9BACI|nr:VCBS repeat-containing protein [Salipaludibacillus keqinensis]PYZ92283.1 spore coat protein [Salipaludibacillus keqinensis]